MKFLCLADMHSSRWALERLADREAREDKEYDALVFAGDIAESVEFAEELIAIIKSKAFYIPGNMDRPQAVEVFKDINIHGKVIDLGTLKIAGFGYSSPTPFGTPGELSEEEIAKGLEKLPVDESTLLITHSPPKGILDNGFGSTSIREFVDKMKPIAHIFGHIHEVSGAQRIHKTLFVNVPPAMRGKAALLNIDNGNAEVKFVEL